MKKILLVVVLLLSGIQTFAQEQEADLSVNNVSQVSNQPEEQDLITDDSADDLDLDAMGDQLELQDETADVEKKQVYHSLFNRTVVFPAQLLGLEIISSLPDNVQLMLLDITVRLLHARARVTRFVRKQWVKRSMKSVAKTVEPASETQK